MTADINLVRTNKEITSVVDKIIDYFKENILQRNFKIGDRLLPERELAQELDVSRPSVREAIKILSIYGVVKVIPGSGVYVCDPDVANFSNFLELSLALKFSLGNNFFEIRAILETGAIRSAAKSITDSELEYLHQQLVKMNNPETFDTLGAEADFDFHLAIIKGTHNEALEFLYHGIEGLLRETHSKLRHVAVKNFQEMHDSIIKSHRAIFDALYEHDPNKAEDAMRDHFEVIQRRSRENLIEM